MDDTNNEYLRALQASVHPMREQILNHEVYHRLETINHLRKFMEHHAFAVWDFMSLLKSLQQHLTCVTLPWIPSGDRVGRRLINEIVLEEESDVYFGEGYSSHFELYRAAMDQCGADTSTIDHFIARLRQGETLLTALHNPDVPRAARTFVEITWQIIESGQPHRIAAAFTLGREELIPDMFRAIVINLQRQFPNQMALLHYYLDRHMHLDEERHAPMAFQMLAGLCGEDAMKWQEAEKTARLALNARIRLWDAVADRLLHPMAANRE